MEGNMSSSSSSSGAHSANPQAIKRRRRTTKHELQVLEDLYAESRNPSLEARQKACTAIGFEMKALQVWLQNRRQKEKKDAGKWKPAYTATGESAASSNTNTSTNVPSSTIHSSYSHSAASSRSSSTSPDVSFHHAPLHPAHPDHPRVNKQHHSTFSTMTTTEDSAVKLPPMLLHTIPPHSSPLAQLPLTLPSISSVMAESSSRDFINHHHHHHASNKLSPMLRQDENTFIRPPFHRTTSADSARSSSTTCSSVRPDIQVRAQQIAPPLKPVVTSAVEAPIQLAPARPIKALRRASSQYSLSIAQDGKAQMLVTEVPESATQKPQLPSLATAILASSPSITSPSTLNSAGSDGSQVASSASSIRKFSSALASAPLSSYNRQALPSSNSNFGRVYSLPSLSTLSNNSATASLKSHNQNNTIFSGGLRLGSPPKKATFTTTISFNNDSHHKRKETDNNTDKNELWMNLDSDPVEPEDEVIMNQNRRMLDSPVKRFTSVKMEDVISSSSSPSSSSLSSSRKRKYIVMKESEVSEQGNDIAEGYAVEKITSLGGAGFVAVTLQATDAPAAEVQNTASNARASPFVRSATTANILSSTQTNILSSSPSKSSISSFQAQLSLQGQTKHIQSRKRSYSKTMLSRSISLDRVILHDDSTDEENSPQKKSTALQQQLNPRSAGLYPSGTILGRPLLSRANSHLGILHSSTPREVSIVGQPMKKSKLDHLDLLSSSLPVNAKPDNAASGKLDVVTATTEERKTPSSPLDLSLANTSLGEPDLSFSTEASQSFDDISREETSDLVKHREMIIEAPILDMINEKIHASSNITSTPSKKQGDTLALAALKGHMSSPIKLKSPNRKILTEVERDCAAVLIGLGFPDVF